MIFEFQKYLSPGLYFNVRRKNSKFAYPKLENFIRDKDFKEAIANEYYASYSALMNGAVVQESNCYSEFETLSVYDNYVFCRKTYSLFWVVYVLIIRIFSFHNPFKEIESFIKTKNVQRSSYKPFCYDNYIDYKSNIISQNPLVSVIIPTLNRYEYLRDVLLDLEKQTYKTFEVIIVDQSDDFNCDFYQNFDLEIQLIHQKEKALWLARNTAIRESKGDYMLLFDDDSRVDEDWIFHHLKCLDFFNASVSSGVSLSKVGDKIPENYSFFRVSDQLDTGNVLIRKSCFQKTGLFDRQFEKQRMGDGEFGMRLYLAGFLNISNPFAERIHLKVSSGGLREMGSWDAFRPKKLLAPRPVPSVLYFFRRYFGNKSALYTIFKTVPFSIVPYRHKSSNKFKALGLLLFVLFFPLWIFVVMRSWLLSSKMIQSGPKINFL